MTEVDALVQHIRGLQGKPFNPADIVRTAVSNVTLNILFGRRFDHMDPDFRKLFADMDAVSKSSSFVLDLIPSLRLLPYYRNTLQASVAAYSRNLQFIERQLIASLQVWTLFLEIVH